MSSKSIYSFDKTNENLSTIFNLEYIKIENLPEEAYDWSTLENIKRIDFGQYSNSYRNFLLSETQKLVGRLRSKQNRTNVTLRVDPMLKALNRQISYLTNRHKESSDVEYMNSIRKFRKAKALLLKNWSRE